MAKQKIGKIFEAVVWICFFGVAISPCVMSAEFFFPAIFPKALVARLFIELALIFYIPLCFLKPEFKPKRSILYVALGVFAFVVFLTSVIGMNFSYSFWGNYERMDGIFSWLHYWVFIVMATGFLNKRKRWTIVFFVLASVAVLMSFYGFFQRLGFEYFGPFKIYETNMGRITGTIANPAFLAVYLLFNFVFSVLIFLDSSAKKWTRYFSLAFLFPILGAYFMTGVRGAFFGFLAGVLVFSTIGFFWIESKKIKKNIFLVFSTFCGLVFILYALSGTNQFFRKNFYTSDFVNQNFGRFFSISFSDSTARTRLLSWKGDVSAFFENPVFGVGPQRFDYVFNKYFDPEFYTLVGNETWWDRAHNMVLEVATTMGVLGLFSYFLVGFLLVFCLAKLGLKYKEKKIESMVLVSFLFAYFVQNLFVFDSVSAYIMLSFFYAYVVFATFDLDILGEKISFICEKTRKTIEPVLNRTSSIDWRVAFVASFLSIAPVFYFFNIKLIPHNRAILYNLAYSEIRPFIQIIGEYEKIVEMSEFDLREVAMKIGQYLAQYALDNRMNSSQIKSSFGFSIQTFEKAVKKSPDDVRLLLTYGNTLNIYAELVKQIDPDQSRSILKKSERILLSALDLGKTRQQVYYSLGNNYMIMGQYEKAIEILEQGIMVDDKTPTAHWVLALSYLQANKPEKVALAVRSALDRKYLFSRESEAETVAKTLLGQNDLETLFMLYDRIAENSGIGKARAKSASVLYLMGKNQDAIEMAHKALLMDPSLKEEVDSFVEKVRKGEKIEF